MAAESISLHSMTSNNTNELDLIIVNLFAEKNSVENITNRPSSIATERADSALAELIEQKIQTKKIIV